MDAASSVRPSGGASLAARCLWICALSFQYGYNISALNSLFKVLSCGTSTPSSWLPTCFDMNANQFGLVTSIYTLGGLAGSLFTGSIADKHGRKAACVAGALSIAAGGLIMSLSVSFSMLVVGRAVIGVGCGIATVIVPTFLSEIAPPERRGRIGVLNQVGIVTGIFTGQCASIVFAHSNTWRFVPVCTAAIAAAQILLAPAMSESPVWLAIADSHAAASADESSGIVYQADDDEGVRDRLLDREATPDSQSESQHAYVGSVSKSPPQTIWGVLTSPLTRKGLRIVVITQIAQQASGINAVIYYSTDIMKKALPTSSAYIALTITAVNIIMTFPPLVLIDRVGRRPLLLLSIGSMGLSSLLLSLTIKRSAVVASIAVVAFVASFSIGLGPIPFLIIPEVVPQQSSAATASLGLSLNWVANFIVGAVFWPLSNAVGQESIFVGFAIIAALATVLVGSVYQ